MSAIAGILWFDGAPAEQDCIEALVGRMASYGPHGQSCWSAGPVALGHCQLRTTSEAADEHLPLTSRDGRYCLVWDGRLDNREQLLGDLRSRGALLQTRSDAELVLESFLAWGQACTNHLLGDFAFAVWDAHEQQLFCVRDHTGARPLYWTRTHRFFAFATDDGALLTLPGVSARPYAAGMAHWLAPGYVPAEPSPVDVSRTWYEELRLFEAGQSIVVNPDRSLQLDKFWQPETGAENRYASDAQCQEAFLEVFGAAVRARLRTAGPVAMLMSGGLDTAGVAAMARREMRGMAGKELHAYSVIYDQPEDCIETRCILSMAEGMGDRFHSIAVPSMTGVAGIDELLEEAWPRSHPEDNSIWLQALLIRVAARAGHRVVLHGTFGDLTNWSPRRYIAHWMQAGQWRQAWRESRAASQHHNYLRDRVASRLWLENFGVAFVPPALKPLAQVMWRGEPAASHGLISPDFLRSIGYRAARISDEPRLSRRLAPVQQAHLKALRFLTFGRTGLARVAGRHGVDTRDPWDDRRVVEFFLRLPLEYRVRDGWTKHLVRATFVDDLSDPVRWRIGKEHLGWHLKARVMQQTQDQCQAYLDNPAASCWRFLDREIARKRYASARCGEGFLPGDELFDMMTLGSWLDRNY